MVPAAFVGIFVAVFPTGSFSFGGEKIWKTSYRFGDASAWSGGKQPFMGDAILLGESQDVFWPQNVVINTEVIFGEGSAVVFVPDGDVGAVPIGQPRKKGEEKVGEVVKFPAVENSNSSNSWFDPRNWDYGKGFNSDPFNLSPVPESDRIPCPGDLVAFPGNATLRVDIEADVSMRSIKLGSQSEAFRSSESFSMFRRSIIGALQFQGTGKVNFQQCPTNSPCPCSNSHPQTLSKICSHVTPHMCQLQTKFCEDPVKPVGSCCGVCGAVAHASVKSTSSWQEKWMKVELIRDEALAKHSDLLAHAGMTHEGLLQIVAVDSRGNLEAAKKALEEIESALMSAALIETTPAILAAQISTLGGPRHPLIIAFLVLLFLSGVVFGALVCAKRHNWHYLPPAIGEYIPDVEFEALQRFFRERSNFFGSGVGEDGGSVSWARLREAHGGGVEEVVGTGVVCLSNPIFDEAGFQDVPSARQKGVEPAEETQQPSAAEGSAEAALPPSSPITNPFAPSSDQLIQIDPLEQQ